MHLRSLRLEETFIPIRSKQTRDAFVALLRKELGRGIQITVSTVGVTVRGVKRIDDQMKLHRLAGEVSDWARSSRRPK
jgi:hypothetical protein